MRNAAGAGSRAMPRGPASPIRDSCRARCVSALGAALPRTDRARSTSGRSRSIDRPAGASWAGLDRGARLHHRPSINLGLPWRARRVSCAGSHAVRPIFMSFRLTRRTVGEIPDVAQRCAPSSANTVMPMRDRTSRVRPVFAADRAARHSSMSSARSDARPGRRRRVPRRVRVHPDHAFVAARIAQWCPHRRLSPSLHLEDRKSSRFQSTCAPSPRSGHA